MGELTSDSRPPAHRSSRAALLLLLAALALIGGERMFATEPQKQSDEKTMERAPVRDPRARGRVARPRPVSPPDRPSSPAPKPAAATLPPKTAAPSPVDPADLAVTRIVFDERDPDATFAVIRGAAVRAGDRIGGWRVHSVERDRVLLGAEGEIELLLEDRER
jgi:hypothetical protein